MRISDWSSDVCSSDLGGLVGAALAGGVVLQIPLGRWSDLIDRRAVIAAAAGAAAVVAVATALVGSDRPARSEEHTSELQSLMRISYAVFCLKKKTQRKQDKHSYRRTHTQRYRR